MLLRPRYSLLTLLVLTALVAGGVKLWYGPHHVVEYGDRLSKEFCVEDEYTYTRQWAGEKLIHGPRIARLYFCQDGDKILWLTEINYYRYGTRLNCRYACQPMYSNQQGSPPFPEPLFAGRDLTADEATDLIETVKKIRPREIAPGMALQENFTGTEKNVILQP